MAKFCRFNCIGTLSDNKVSKDFNSSFEQRITIINIPVEVCSTCKQLYINKDTQNRINEILNQEHSQRIVDFEK